MDRPLAEAHNNTTQSTPLHSFDSFEPFTWAFMDSMLDAGPTEQPSGPAMAIPHAVTAAQLTPFASTRTATEQPSNSSASSGNITRQVTQGRAPEPALGGSKRRTQSAPSTLERKLEVNRAAQKRFRQRQKAGCHAHFVHFVHCCNHWLSTPTCCCSLVLPHGTKPVLQPAGQSQAS